MTKLFLTVYRVMTEYISSLFKAPRPWRNHSREQWLFSMTYNCFLYEISIHCMSVVTIQSWNVWRAWIIGYFQCTIRSGIAGVWFFFQTTYKIDQNGFGMRTLLYPKYNLCVESINMFLNRDLKFSSQKLFTWAAREPQVKFWNLVEHPTQQEASDFRSLVSWVQR